jgi:hypothetical protein
LRRKKYSRQARRIELHARIIITTYKRAAVLETKESEKEPEKIIRVDIMAKTRGFILTIILIIFCEGEC